MKLTKTFGLAFMAAALLFTSCKKDDDDDGPAAVTCKLSKSVFFDQAGARDDSATYTYSGDKISKATLSDGYYYNFDYSGDKISKRSGFVAGTNTAEYYQQVSYNSDGTISKVESFEQTSGTNYAIYDRMEFVYSSGKIQKIDYFAVSGTNSQKVAEILYTYTGNNITQAKITDLSTTPSQSITYSYTYDANNNFMKKQNAQIHLIDPFFGDVDPTLLPFAISANNVASLSIVGSGSAALTYNLDDKQNLKSINVAGRSIVEYGYQCQ